TPKKKRMLNTEKASANVDLIRVKATQLKRLLSAAESAAEYENLHQISAAETQTRQLRTQLDAYFDETLRRFERRRTELKAALDRRLAAAAAVNTGKEQTLLTEAAKATSAVCSEAASVDLLRRLDDAIALREQPGIDLAEAERRTRRLLSCLRLNSSCHDDGDGEDADWVRQRRADNPFAAGASSATVSEPPTTESAYGEFASSGSIDFSHVLTPSNSLKACDATGSQSPSAETPNPYRLDHTPTHSSSVSAIDMFPPLSATQPLSIQPAGANGLSYLQHDASFDADDRPPSISDSPSSDSSDTSSFREIKDCRTVGAPKSVTYVHDKFYTVEGGCIRKYRCQDGRCLGKLALTDDECNPVDYRPLYVRRCTENDWLLIIECENDRVLCVDSDGVVRFQAGPRISAKYRLQGPVEAVSNGSHLFICCPEQAIFIVRFSDNRSVTQTIEHIGLSQPICIAWSLATNRLIVINDEGHSASYTFHALEVTGSSFAGGLAKASDHCMSIQSDYVPEFVCLPDSDRVVFTHNKTYVGAFDRECLYDPQCHELYSFSKPANWGHITDICVVDEFRVAVCDKKTRWIRLLNTC
ncbi:hypothetical protein BOX15_Mlig019003g2, partial [Macrostomum lignano]